MDLVDRKRLQRVPRRRVGILSIEEEPAAVDEQPALVRLELNVLPGDLQVFDSDDAGKDRQTGKNNTRERRKPAGPVSTLALPQLVKGAADQCSADPDALFAELGLADMALGADDIGRERFHFPYYIAFLVIDMCEQRGKGLFRLTPRQHGEHMVAVVGAKEIADLFLAPPGLGKVRRADHDQIIRVVERVADAVGQGARRGELVLVAEAVADPAAAGLVSVLRGHVEMLDLLLHRDRCFPVDRLVAIADKCGVVPLFVCCSHSCYLIVLGQLGRGGHFTSGVKWGAFHLWGAFDL